MRAHWYLLAASTALLSALAACPLTSTSTPKDSGPKTSPATPVDILTQRGDNGRSGVYAHETALTLANVNTKTFGKLSTIPVDGLVWAQPLFVSGLNLGGKTRNVLVVATGHNSVYAFDADAGGSPLWQTSLGPSVPVAAIPTTDIPLEVGVISTPVIDRAAGVIYVLNEDYFGKTFDHHLHVLDLLTGRERQGSPIQVTASIPGTVDNGTTLLFDHRTQLQRTGLLLSNGVAYAAFASHGDMIPAHGFVVGYQYSAASGSISQTAAWASTQDGSRGGIWQAGQGLVADSSNNVYAMIANGTTTVPTGGTSYGQAFIKLSPTLSVLDWFIPQGFEELNETDTDVGSGGPVFVPGTRYVIGAGKGGVMYVVDTTNMGHTLAGDAGDTQIVQEFPVTQAFYGSPLVWSSGGTTRMYVWGPGKQRTGPPEPLKEFVFANGKFATTPVATSSATNVPAAYEGANPVAILALSWNGTAASSAVLWAAQPTANPNRMTVPGVLYAFDPVTLSQLWSSAQVPGDDLGNYAKFVVPTVANGKVYMATHSNAVAVYGLKTGS